MSNPIGNLVVRYGVAVISIVLATGLRLLLDPLLGDRYPFATFFFAIVLSAWYGGFGPAASATVLGALAAVCFLLPVPERLPFEGLENQAGIVLYLAVGFGISMIGGGMRAAQARAEAN